MEKDIETRKLEIEEKKLLVEKFKALEGQARGLLILAVALGGGIGTIMLNFNSYQNKEFIAILLALSIFVEAFVLFVIVKLYFDAEEIRKRW